VLVNYRAQGGADADIFRSYPALSPADLEAAWEYASAHREEIDQAIRDNETECR
jgi:type III restriction enzyme